MNIVKRAMKIVEETIEAISDTAGSLLGGPEPTRSNEREPSPEAQSGKGETEDQDE